MESFNSTGGGGARSFGIDLDAPMATDAVIRLIRDPLDTGAFVIEASTGCGVQVGIVVPDTISKLTNVLFRPKRLRSSLPLI